MATFPDAPQPGADGGEPVRSTLRIEMNAAERGLLTLFAASFLEWIRDARNSRFARDAGAPASVSFDEAADDDATATLRVTVTWPLPPADSSAPSLPAVPAASVDARPSLFYEPLPASAPDPAPPVDLTSMVVEVFERSKTLHRRSPREEQRLSPGLAPLVLAAARARERVRRWTADAGSFSRDVLERGRHRGRDAAGSGRSLRGAGPDGLRVVVRLPKVPTTGVRWVSWATAALCLAAVVYVAWPTETFTSATVVPPLIAEKAAAPTATSGAPAPPESRASASDDARRRPAAAEAPPPTAEAALAAAPVTPPRPAAAAAPRAVAVLAATAGPKPASAKAVHAPAGYVGSLVITSEPGGADVTVDGLPRGRTPLSIQQLTVGSRVIRVDMPGHQPWAWAVSVVANKQTAVAVKLVPAAAPHDSPGVVIDRILAPGR